MCWLLVAGLRVATERGKCRQHNEILFIVIIIVIIIIATSSFLCSCYNITLVFASGCVVFS